MYNHIENNECRNNDLTGTILDYPSNDHDKLQVYLQEELKREPIQEDFNAFMMINSKSYFDRD